MVRVPASGSPKGSIFVNPGGPGGSGVEFVANGFRLDDATMSDYHLVGFDPRGVGQSDPLDCGFAFEAGPLPDFSPDDAAERTQLDRWAEGLADQCADRAGDRLDQFDTATVARDLEAMRAAVGDPKLRYYGFSYGTLIGLRYMELFPDRVGAMVLDGVVDPQQRIDELLIDQAVGFESALARMDDACVAELDCPPQGIVSAYSQLNVRLEAEGPIGQVGPTELANALAFAGYSQGFWQPLAQALSDALAGDFAGIEAMSDGYYDGFSQELYTAVECIDGPRPETPAEWDGFVAEAVAAAPLLGSLVANDLRPCAYWPIDGSNSTPFVPTGPPGLPVIVIGTTGDPATPFRNAAAVASALDSGVLITHEGEGHTAYRSSDCVRQIVAEYFGSGATPRTRSC